jgi:hypothetical protein
MPRIAPKPKMKYDIGDTILWTNPEDQNCTGEHQIKEIVTKTGLIEDMDSVIILCNDAGTVTEVYVREIV